MPRAVNAKSIKLAGEIYRMIRVSLYEDNEGLRKMLEAAIASDDRLQLAGSHNNCVEILRDVETDQPNVVIMDIDMPGISGIEGVQLLKSKHTDIEVIMNTVFDDDDRIFNALQSGATGYLLKKSGLQELITAITEIVKGGSPMSPSIARKVLSMIANPVAASKQVLDLTSREIEILDHLSQGMSYKMVAAQLHLSIDTIRSHIKKIYEKLHVHSATEAINKVYIFRQNRQK